MADDVAITAGSGTTIATDDASGRHLQLMKLAVSANGDATLIPADATNGLDVDVTRSALPTGAATLAEQQTQTGHLDGVEGLLTTIDADTGGILTAVQTLDDAISGSEMQVDVVAALPAGTNNIGDVDVASIAAGDNNIGNVDVVTVPADPFGANADAAVSAGATGSIQAKLRRISADIDAIKTAVETLDNTVGGSELQVDIVGALPAGTAAIGKLAANTGVDIGDVDVTSVVPGTGATNLGKAEDAGHTTGDVGVMALAVRTDAPAALAGSTAEYDPLKTNSTGGMWVSEVANPAGGCSIFKSLDLDESEEEVKASAGCVYGCIVMNRTTSVRYLKFYNATAASVSVGTTVPVMTIPIPEAAASGAAGIMLNFPGPGVSFSTAICVAVTTGFADNDTGAPGANDVIIDIFYA